MFGRISVDPEVRFGKPCVKGTRITVGDVLGALSRGTAPQELVAEYPQLTVDDVLECLAFAASREQ